MKDRIRKENVDSLHEEFFRFNIKTAGLTLGSFLGLVVMIVTIWLLIVTQGNEAKLGSSVQLISQVFIGYEVSFLGSIIGYAYGFFLGTLSGFMIAWIYNRIASVRNY